MRVCRLGIPSSGASAAIVRILEAQPLDQIFKKRFQNLEPIMHPPKSA